MRNTLRLVVVAVLMMGGAASAHEGHDHGADAAQQHIMGTVESVAPEKLVVKDTGGKSIDVHIDHDTRYENGDEPGKAADLKKGSRVVIHGQPMKDGTVHAKTVRYGKPAKAH